MTKQRKPVVSKKDSPETPQKQEATRITPILLYIPKGCRKKGEPPFVTKVEYRAGEPERFDLPIAELKIKGPTSLPLKGFVRPEKDPVLFPGSLPIERTNGFDPNAFRLISKA